MNWQRFDFAGYMRYPPDSPQNSGNMPERGSGDGGGASGSLFGMNILCFGLMGAGTALVLIGACITSGSAPPRILFTEGLMVELV